MVSIVPVYMTRISTSILAQFLDLCPIFGLDGLEVCDGVALWLMLPFEPFDGLNADLLDQAWSVVQYVAGKVVVTRRALLVYVQRLKPEFWRARHGTEVAGVVLPFMVSAAAYAWLAGITQADPLIDQRLRLSSMRPLRLDLLLLRRMLFPRIGLDRLNRLLPARWSYRNRTSNAADLLRRLRRLELLAAVLASLAVFLGLGDGHLDSPTSMNIGNPQ